MIGILRMIATILTFTMMAMLATIAMLVKLFYSILYEYVDNIAVEGVFNPARH